MLGTCDVGDSRKVRVTFRDGDGHPWDVDEESVRFGLLNPATGAVTVKQGLDVRHEATGVYSVIVQPDAPGRWYIRAEGSNLNGPVDQEDYLLVRDALVPNLDARPAAPESVDSARL
jgi:hypothetical protein